MCRFQIFVLCSVESLGTSKPDRYAHFVKPGWRYHSVSVFSVADLHRLVGRMSIGCCFIPEVRFLFLCYVLESTHE